MRKKYDFSKGKRGPAINSPGRTSLTITLDNKIIETFRKRSASRGKGYQDAMNDALLAAMNDDNAPLTADTLRKILRQELRKAE